MYDSWITQSKDGLELYKFDLSGRTRLHFIGSLHILQGETLLLDSHNVKLWADTSETESNPLGVCFVYYFP